MPQLPTYLLGLRIVYDKNQFNYRQAEESTRATIRNLIRTFYDINIVFRISYALGSARESNQFGVYTYINSEGTVWGNINVFLFVNNTRAGFSDKADSGSMYAPSSRQIFLWEGAESQRIKPTASNADYKLSDLALAHEIGHLFLHFAGYRPGATTQAEAFLHNTYDDFFYILPTNRWLYHKFPLGNMEELPDDFDFDEYNRKQTLNSPNLTFPSAVPRLYRLGARRIYKQTRT